MPTNMTAKPVPENQRLNFLPKMFSPSPLYFLGGENLIFGYAKAYLTGYTGGLWTFYKASNGAHFAAPSEEREWEIRIASNGFEATVSTEAAGIIVSLFALNVMVERAHGRGDGEVMELLADRYYELRDFAIQHPEYRTILKAID
jgi:Antirestriction protein